MTDEGKDFRLLLVDDNLTNLSLLAQIVEMDLPRVQVFSARTAAEALELAAREELDGAFVDVQMPGISGLELCRQLKEDARTSHVPVVLMTAHIATAELRAEGLDAGAYDFISQPISNVEMLARIKVMLRLRQTEKQLLAANETLRRQVESKTSVLRWLSGLLLAGDGEMSEEDRLLAARLEERIPEDRLISAELLSGTLFREMPRRWQRTVLKLALLDEMPRRLVEQLAEIEDIDAALEYLWRHNFFVEQLPGRETAYAFHSSLRERLLVQLDGVLSAQEQDEVCSRAADWYVQQGQLLTACKYLLNRNLYSEAELLLSQQGMNLIYTSDLPALIDLLDRIPEQVAVKRCWFALFLGIGRLQRRPKDAVDWLELARTRFLLLEERRGELLALAHLVQLYLLVDGLFSLGEEVKPRIAEILEQHVEDLDTVSKALGFGFLALIQLFMGNSLQQAERNVREGLQFAASSGFDELQFLLRQFSTYLAIMRGRFALGFAEQEICQHLGKGIAETAPSRLMQKVLRTDLLLASGRHECCRDYFQQVEHVLGRDFLQQTSLGPVFCRYRLENLLASGNRAEARDRLDICMTRGLAVGNEHNRSMLLQFRALLWLGEADREEMLRADLQEATELRERTGGLRYRLVNLIVAASCYAGWQDYRRAEAALQQALKLSSDEGEYLLRGGIYARQAELGLLRGREEEALGPLRQLLELLAEREQDSFYLLTPELLRRLLPLAVTRQVLPEVAQRLATLHLGCQLRPDGSLLPLLELRTLGTTGFFLAGKKLLDSSELGSVARQIVDLLAVAPNHRLGLESLLGMIWPESSATRARASFDTSLSRLRKALDAVLSSGNSRDYLVLEKGILSLQNTRVDCRLFADRVNKALQHLRRQESWQAGLAFREAEQLWNGPFLAGHDLLDELIQEQRKLTEMRLDMLETWSGLLSGERTEESLDDLFREGLQLDPTREPLVGRYYRYLLSRNETVQARKTLDNYHRALLAADYPESDAREIVLALEQEERRRLRDNPAPF